MKIQFGVKRSNKENIMNYLIGMGTSLAERLLKGMGWKCLIVEEGEKVIVLYRHNGKIKGMKIISEN